MRKAGLVALVFFLVPYVCFGQSATTRSAGQDFPTLNASTEMSTVIGGKIHDVKFVVSTEARFIYRLISDEGWASLSENDKWQVAVYEYSYKFENNSDEKISVLFTNRDVLLSLLPEIFGNYGLILEPREKREIKFIANTKVQEAHGGSMYLSLWDDKMLRWELFGASAASLYVPRFNAFYERLN